MEHMGWVLEVQTVNFVRNYIYETGALPCFPALFSLHFSAGVV